MTTLMQMREWLFSDVRIYERDEIYEKCVNNITIEVFRSLINNIEDIKEYWRICDELDGH